VANTGDETPEMRAGQAFDLAPQIVKEVLRELIPERFAEDQTPVKPARLDRAWYPGHIRFQPGADPAGEQQFQPGADPAGERAEAFGRYFARVDIHVRMGRLEGGWDTPLKHALDTLSYDLAVIQANYVINRGLRGGEAMRIFRAESAELVKGGVKGSHRGGGNGDHILPLFRMLF
jgi:hypothetical protein